MSITLRNDSAFPQSIVAEDGESIFLMPRTNQVVDEKFLTTKNGNSYPSGVSIVETYVSPNPGTPKSKSDRTPARQTNSDNA